MLLLHLDAVSMTRPVLGALPCIRPFSARTSIHPDQCTVPAIPSVSVVLMLSCFYVPRPCLVIFTILSPASDLCRSHDALCMMRSLRFLG